MRWLTVAVFAVIALGWTASVAADPQIDRGIKVYAEQKCAVCHSIGDQGNKKGPLDGVGTKLTVQEIKDWIVDPKMMTEKTKAPRKPFMKAYPDLPKADLDALIAYMVNLKKK
jgi:mono/diheme cytochrome c family protein